MLVFHCTHNAINRLQHRYRQDEETSYTIAVGWHWQLHAITVVRQHVFIAMDQESRFVVLLWGIRKGNSDALLEQFCERLHQHVLQLTAKYGLVNQQEADAGYNAMLGECSQFTVLSGQTSSSVQAHINDVAFLLKDYVAENGLPASNAEVTALDVFHNDAIRTRGDSRYFVPEVAWYSDWLNRYTDFPADRLHEVNDRYLLLKRKEWG